jgi:uncharacterized membrane protein
MAGSSAPYFVVFECAMIWLIAFNVALAPRIDFDPYPHC